jgi:hypothetical protein
MGLIFHFSWPLVKYVLIRPHTGDRRGAYRILVGKSERNTPLGRPVHRWENNIKMDLPKIKMRGCGLDCCGSQ